MSPRIFMSKADHRDIARGFRPKPAHQRRNYRHSVPQLARPNPRAEERERKRRKKAGATRPEPRAPHGLSFAAIGQTGHRPNCKLRGRGVVHRNHIWPEGKVARPGRMG
jgi:hypothetical protein